MYYILYNDYNFKLKMGLFGEIQTSSVQTS